MGLLVWPPQVRKAIELLFRRNPMGAVEEYGLFLADHYDSGLHASGTTSEDCDGDCHEGVWLDDAALLANLNIGPVSLILSSDILLDLAHD